MKEQLLKALRCKIEYPYEHESTKYDDAWGQFRYTDEFDKFFKLIYRDLSSYLYEFLSYIAPDFSESEKKQELINQFVKIMLNPPIAISFKINIILNKYKKDWLPSNREKLELLISSFEQKLDEVLLKKKESSQESKNIDLMIQVEGLESSGVHLKEQASVDSLTEETVKNDSNSKDSERTSEIPPSTQVEETAIKDCKELPNEIREQDGSKHVERISSNGEDLVEGPAIKDKQPPVQEIGSVEDSEPIEEVIIKWNHLDIEDGPDKHEESFSKWDKNAFNPITLIGARVRGKKHKHEGTNCDDWFAMESVGKWNVIAVSDGAGSKKFSRVGAKVSSEAAVEFLMQQLENCNLEITGEGNDFSRDPESYQFVNKDLAYIEESLHTAFFKAYHAVEQAVNERMNGEEASVYREILHRDLEVNDLSCTLLLAVQTIVNGKSFILACQIGDGATVAITENPKHPVFVLGVSDGGQYSGETDFLTSRKFEKQNYLLSRTYPCYGAIRALMVMTDGVADDYFPANERMNLLYEDLCHEKIIVNVNEEDYDAQAERLKYWLDSYQVRGSFDDRTLVVLYKGDSNE